MNAAYEQSRPNLSQLKVNQTSYPVKRAKLDFNQWQVGIGTCYKIGWFIPYLGIDYANFRARIERLTTIEFLIPSKHVTFKETYPCGIFLGCGFTHHRAISANIELRLINENAVSVSADFKF